MIVNSELICKCLQSLDRRERQRALNDLLEFAASSENAPEDIIRIYDETYLYILKSYSDKYESCRELAISVVTEFFKHLPRNDYYLQYTISTLANRIGQKAIIEESEELRLLLLIQLDFLLDKFRVKEEESESNLLLKCYDEIVDILVKELKDNYPSAQRAACACIRTLAEATPSFHYRAEAFVKPIIPMLQHKHSMNRVNAIETLGVVSLHIFTNSDCVSEIITEISPLLMDSMPLVRKECGKAGCRMLIELRDRYSFFPRILPLVLCCLNDETPDVRDYIEGLWVKCGDKYYEENENELSKKEIVDELPPRYPANIQRPSLGCRAIVQRSLQVTKLVLRETIDWKEGVRLHSLKLLWQIILHAEMMIAVHVLDIFPVIARTCADPDKIVTKQALKCAELMGTLMIYKEWFTSCLGGLEANAKLGFVKCFYSMFSAAASNSTREDIQKLARLLHQKDFSHSLNPELQLHLLKLVDVIIEAKSTIPSISEAMENLSIEDVDKKTDEYLYHIAIKVVALSYDSVDENLKQFGQEIILKLANNDETLVAQLHVSYLNSVLATFDCLDAQNEGKSEPILLLHGVICTCKFRSSYIGALKSLILIVWEHALSDGQMKIMSGISIAMMSWAETISTNEEISLELLRDFIKDIIVPHLTWKPGLSAEGMRTLATATLCSMAQGAQKQAPIILSELSTILPGLVEDHSATTRVYTLRSIMSIGPIGVDHLRTLGFAVIQRLDDPSPEVREWAARAITKIRVRGTEDESEQATVKSFIFQVLSTLFLHFEGPESRLRKIIKETIVAIGKIHSETFLLAFNKAYAMARSSMKSELDEIKLSVGS